MSMDRMSREYPILLVEDNPDDVTITKRALEKGQIRNRLYIAHDGEEALKFIRKEEEYRDAPTPAIVLLDLRMPKLDGFDVLREIKKDDAHNRIPTIVLTTSERDADVEKAYRLGCNSYIVKPVNFENFIKTIIEIKQYWLVISKIPAE